MKMRFLGNTGVRVSELCMGTWTFGGWGTNIANIFANELLNTRVYRKVWEGTN